MSIIEVLVVVALSTVVVGIVITVLTSLHRWDRRLGDGNARAAQVARLAEDIRADVRSATDVALAPDGELVLTSPNREPVRYTVVPQGCRRTAGEPGGGSSVELYRVGPGEAWTLGDGPPGRRRMIVVTLARPAAADRPERTVPVVVYAALGADRPPVGATSTGTPSTTAEAPAE